MAVQADLRPLIIVSKSAEAEVHADISYYSFRTEAAVHLPAQIAAPRSVSMVDIDG